MGNNDSEDSERLLNCVSVDPVLQDVCPLFLLDSSSQSIAAMFFFVIIILLKHEQALGDQSECWYQALDKSINVFFSQAKWFLSNEPEKL